MLSRDQDLSELTHDLDSTPAPSRVDEHPGPKFSYLLMEIGSLPSIGHGIQDARSYNPEPAFRGAGETAD